MAMLRQFPLETHRGITRLYELPTQTIKAAPQNLVEDLARERLVGTNTSARSS